MFAESDVENEVSSVGTAEFYAVPTELENLLKIDSTNISFLRNSQLS